jgi:hypothetical protein
MAYRSLVMTALELIHRQATRRQRREKASRSPGDLNSLALARRRRDDLSYKMRLGPGMTALELADRQTAGTEAAGTSREHWATVGPAHW